MHEVSCHECGSLALKICPLLEQATHSSSGRSQRTGLSDLIDLSFSPHSQWAPPSLPLSLLFWIQKETYPFQVPFTSWLVFGRNRVCQEA